MTVKYTFFSTANEQFSRIDNYMPVIKQVSIQKNRTHQSMLPNGN